MPQPTGRGSLGRFVPLGHAPAPVLTEVRQLFLAFAVGVAGFTFAVHLVTQDTSPASKAQAAGALLVLVWGWTETFRRQRTTLAGDGLEGAMLVLIAAALPGRVLVLAILYTAVMFGALYGSRGRVAGRTLVYVVAYLATLALGPYPIEELTPLKLRLPFVMIPILGLLASVVQLQAASLAGHEQSHRDLIDLHGQVEAQVRERTAQLSASLQEKTALLHEKDVLLREIHHRVKNNLHSISLLLELQADRAGSTDVQALTRASQVRIKAMALVHEKLYQSAQVARIDLGTYLADLIREISHAHGFDPDRLTLRHEAVACGLTIDQAIPCGLLVNELLANAIKHAFPDGRPGQIQVELRVDVGRTITLIVSDDGVGLPPDLAQRQTATLGLQLVDSLVQDLHGRLQVETGRGTRSTITFPCSSLCEQCPPPDGLSGSTPTDRR